MRLLLFLVFITRCLLTYSISPSQDEDGIMTVCDQPGQGGNCKDIDFHYDTCNAPPEDLLQVASLTVNNWNMWGCDVSNDCTGEPTYRFSEPYSDVAAVWAPTVWASWICHGNFVVLTPVTMSYQRRDLTTGTSAVIEQTPASIAPRHITHGVLKVCDKPGFQDCKYLEYEPGVCNYVEGTGLYVGSLATDLNRWCRVFEYPECTGIRDHLRGTCRAHTFEVCHETNLRDCVNILYEPGHCYTPQNGGLEVASMDIPDGAECSVYPQPRCGSGHTGYGIWKGEQLDVTWKGNLRIWESWSCVGMEQHPIPNYQKLADWFKAKITASPKTIWVHQIYARDQSSTATTTVAAQSPVSILPRDAKFRSSNKKGKTKHKDEDIDCEDVEIGDDDYDECMSSTSTSGAAPTAKPLLVVGLNIAGVAKAWGSSRWRTDS